MKNIVHVESVLRVVLGEVDADGDVINKTPLDFQLPKLTQEVFDSLVKAVEDAKEKLRQN